LTHVQDRLAAKVNDELEIGTWQSTLAGCSGLQAAFSGSYSSNTSTVQISGVSITSANVVAEMTKSLQCNPTKIKNRRKNLHGTFLLTLLMLTDLL